MSYYEAYCQFCGEDVGPPEDDRAHFTFRDVTFYPGAEDPGVQFFLSPVEEWQDPKENPGISVHHECWTSYWDGMQAGHQFYEEDTT